MAYVLIIEGDRAKAYRLSTMCRRLGLRPHLSPDSLHGLMRALRDKPDIILVDAKDNWAGALSPDSLRRDGVLSLIPVIVIGEELDGRLAAQAGVRGGDAGGEQRLEKQIRTALGGAGWGVALAAGPSDSAAILPHIVRDSLDKPLN